MHHVGDEDQIRDAEVVFQGHRCAAGHASFESAAAMFSATVRVASLSKTIYLETGIGVVI